MTTVRAKFKVQSVTESEGGLKTATLIAAAPQNGYAGVCPCTDNHCPVDSWLALLAASA